MNRSTEHKESVILPPQEEPKEPVATNLLPNDQNNHVLNLDGFIEVVTTIPTFIPQRFYDQIKIYLDDPTGPTTKRLYVYNSRGSAWSYTALT